MGPKEAGKRARQTLPWYSVEATIAGLGPGVLRVIAALLEHYGNAKDQEDVVWRTAPALKELLGEGFTADDCAELREKGLLEVASVKEFSARLGPRFEAGGRPPGTKLVALTPAGARLARRAFRLLTEPKPVAGGTAKASGEVPFYDRESRRLWLGDVLVKELGRSAPEQERVLETFQELHWKGVVDDPLSGKSGRDPRRHLEQTVGNLNRGMANPLIHFFVSGNRTQVGWKRVRA